MLRLPVYLDYNATTPCDARVVEAMLPYFSEKFGNAASHNHAYGWQAEEAVAIAREQVARLINAQPQEVVFTSGATEACNLALKGVFETYGSKDRVPHIIACDIEHKAVLDPCSKFEKMGADVTYIKVGQEGLIDPGDVEAAFRPGTLLVAIMYANNEIGTIMPVRQIGEIAKKKRVLFFTDATQAVGKISVDINRDGIDLMAFSSHKMYGPKGVGALYVRRKDPRVKLTPQLDGGGHERGMRSGTLNVPGIVGFGKACEICMNEMAADGARVEKLRDRLENSLLEMDATSVNGDRTRRLSHVTNLAFKYANSESLLTALNKNLALSTGSACMSAQLEPSYVLKALGLSDEMARSSLRFSLGRYTTEEEIDYAIEQVKKQVIKLREIQKQFES